MVRKKPSGELGRTPPRFIGDMVEQNYHATVQRQREELEVVRGTMVLTDGKEILPEPQLVLEALRELRDLRRGKRNPIRTRTIANPISLSFYQQNPDSETIRAIEGGMDPRGALDQLHFAFLDGVDVSLPPVDHRIQGFNLFDRKVGAALMISGIVLGGKMYDNLRLSRHVGFNPDVDTLNPSRGPSGHGPRIDFS